MENRVRGYVKTSPANPSPGSLRSPPSPARGEGKLTQNFNPVILDHGVGEKFVGGVFQRRLCLRLVRASELDVEDLALTDAGDAIDAERFQRAFDGLALRVENAGLEGDGNARFHDRFSLSIIFSENRFPLFGMMLLTP